MQDIAGWLEANGWDITSRDPLSARQERGSTVRTVQFSEGRLLYTVTQQVSGEQSERDAAPGGGTLRAVTSSYKQTTVTAEYDGPPTVEVLQAAMQIADRLEKGR